MAVEGSHYSEDKREEEEFIKVLRKHNIYQKLGYTEERSLNKDNQIEGVDVWLFRNNLPAMKCDEKIQGKTHLNKPTPTWCMELAGRTGFYNPETKKNDWRLGWFMNENLKTTHYVLYNIWTHREFRWDNCHTFHAEDVKSFELFLVSKARLWQLAESNGFSREVFKTMITEIIHSGTGGEHKRDFIKGTKLYYSKPTEEGKGYAEEPILWVIFQPILVELSEKYAYFEQGPDGGFYEKPGRWSKKVEKKTEPKPENQPLARWFSD